MDTTDRRDLFMAAVAFAIGMLLAWTTLAVAAPTACPDKYFGGQAPDITNERLAQKSRPLCFEAFAVMHSGITKTPLWSAERLTKNGLASAKTLVRENSFHPDESIPASERAELKDYSRSGYDRGHLAPNGDMPTKKAQYESFSLANIIPQNPDNNRYIWEGVESAVRTYVKRHGELYVITGPVFAGSEIKQLNGRLFVPTHIYKAVYDPRKGAAAAYVVENTADQKYYVMSMQELEKWTGITMFPAMPASAKAKKLELPEPTPHNSKGKGNGNQYTFSNALKKFFR